VIDNDELNIELAQRRLIHFCDYTKDDWVTNWHHKHIADALDKVIEGKTKRLIISCPPRVGKSEIATRRFPAYALGKNPDLSIISCSYAYDLASRMNRDVQRIIDSPQYANVFPGTRLTNKNVRSGDNNSYLKNSEIFEIIDHKGVYRSAGVGAGITGMGMEIGIIDDPIKDAMEANSQRVRQNIWDWYTAAFQSRLEKDGAMIVIQTRWHEDDLTGRLLDGKGDWEYIKLEAIKETHQDFDPREMGDALWPEKFDIQRYKDIKIDAGSRVFEALYQQNPKPQEGTLIKPSWINTTDGPPPVTRELIQSWDLSFKGNANSDYVVGTVWAKIEANYYMVDMVRGRWDFTETIKQFEMLTRKWPKATRKIVEDAANGAALYSTLRNKIPGITLWKPKTDKVSRLQAVSPLFEAGNVHFNSMNEFHDDMVQELTGFPFGTNDDMVDSITQALLNLKTSTPVFRSVGKREMI